MRDHQQGRKRKQAEDKGVTLKKKAEEHNEAVTDSKKKTICTTGSIMYAQPGAATA